jgi:hypothetical protein
VLGAALALRSAIGSGSQILDGDDVQSVQGHDLTIAVYHGQGARSDEDHLRMADGIFAAMRGAQSKRFKPAAGDALANSFQIHVRTVPLHQGSVNPALPGSFCSAARLVWPWHSRMSLPRSLTRP